ncbi:hypothetical protein KEM52_002033, partial [Ascosphaera acerosa]
RRRQAGPRLQPPDRGAELPQRHPHHQLRHLRRLRALAQLHSRPLLRALPRAGAARQHHPPRARPQAHPAQRRGEEAPAGAVPAQGVAAAAHPDCRPRREVPRPPPWSGRQDHQKVGDGGPLCQLPLGHI